MNNLINNILNNKTSLDNEIISRKNTNHEKILKESKSWLSTLPNEELEKILSQQKQSFNILSNLSTDEKQQIFKNIRYGELDLYLDQNTIEQILKSYVPNNIVTNSGHNLTNQKGYNIVINSNEISNPIEIIDPKKIVLVERNLTPKLNITDIAEIYSNLILNIKNNQNNGIFGVLGAWGRGKSYFISHLVDNFDNSENQIVKFSAWKYQKAPQLWAHLFETFAEEYFAGKRKIIRLFRYNFKRNQNKVITEFIFSLLWMIILFTFNDLSTFIKSDYSEIIKTIISLIPISTVLLCQIIAALKAKKQIVKDILKNQFKRYSFENTLGIQNEIHKELKILLETWITQKNVKSKKIILIIDDIDRCKPDNVIDFLDSIKVILDDDVISSRIKIILAIDNNILESILKKRYKELFVDFNTISEKQYTRDYFDKIFIFCTHLPPMDKDDRSNILDSIFETYHTDEKVKNNEYKKSFRINKSSLDIANRAAIQTQLTESFDKQISLSELEFMKNEFTKINNTPRRLKILYNRYVFTKQLLARLYPSQLNKYTLEEVIKIINDTDGKYIINSKLDEEIIKIIKISSYD